MAVGGSIPPEPTNYGESIYFYQAMKVHIGEKKKEIIKTIEALADPVTIKGLEALFDKHFKGFGGKASIDKVYDFIFDILIERDLLFAIDWKWRVQDELAFFKEKIPGFEYELLALKEDNEFRLTGSIKIGNNVYDFEKCSLHEFLAEINDILDNLDASKRVLIVDGITGDTLFYAIVEKDNYYYLSNSEYLPYVLP